MLSKGVKIVLIVFLIFIIMGLIGAMVFVMVNRDKNYSMSFLAFGDKTKMLLQEEFDIEDIKEIVTKGTSSNIKFVEGNSDKVRVTIYGTEGENATANINDNKLEINKDNNRIYVLAFLVYMRDEIIVELPKSYDGDVGIFATSGNVDVLNLDKAYIKVETSSGNVSCGDLLDGDIKATSGNIRIGNGQKVNAKVNSGNIKIRNVAIGNLSATSGNISTGEIKEANITTNSGSIHVDKTDRITAETTSGGIIVNEINGFCDLSCKSGGVKVEKCFLNENSRINTTSGGVTVKETNDIYVAAKTTSGGIKVENSNRMAEVELKIEATSGGIKVNR